MYCIIVLSLFLTDRRFKLDCLLTLFVDESSISSGSIYLDRQHRAKTMGRDTLSDIYWNICYYSSNQFDILMNSFSNRYSRNWRSRNSLHANFFLFVCFCSWLLFLLLLILLLLLFTRDIKNHKNVSLAKLFCLASTM